MKKIILAIIVMTLGLNAWEINTHRAIDRKAIENSTNLNKFVKNSGIPTNNYYYNNEEFEEYGMSYIQYIEDDKRGEDNGVAQWGQKFEGKPSFQNMLEAGTILEDAQWSHWLDGGKYNFYDIADGRFNNHFADPQNNYNGLWSGGESALLWAWGNGSGERNRRNRGQVKGIGVR